ncbi:MAG: alpha/beta hydrolase [Oscillospiraceae bacterium]
MAINPAMKMALKALSYDVSKDNYKLRRTASEIKGPHVLRPLYELWDKKILVDDREITVRIYPAPKGCNQKLILFFHGGGWVTESINTYNNVCKSLAKRMRCRVASVEYGLAPEHPFPHGLNDCYEVAKVIYTQPELFGVKKENITLIGDSAGGNLAAAVSLRARDTGEFSVPRQVLVYPATFNNHSESSPFPSVKENGEDYLLTSAAVCEYMKLYKSKDEDYDNPYFAPLLTKDFSNQPDTLVISAEFCPLRDEGEEYARRLKIAGNKVSLYRMKDALHGFLSMGINFVQVKTAYDLIAKFMNIEKRDY